jgi:hypothetical protein
MAQEKTPKTDPKPTCTWIDGIGSSQAIDTAGEIVDIAGLDCSSLVGGPFNYEHKSDVPAQICGKILEYKKIFSDQDCENDRHKYYWEKCKTPFLYVMGRLFDDKKDSAREVAALFADDAEHPDEQPMIGFSVEGSKISKSGIIVDKSIARKITLTGAPANKTCIAEMVPNPDADAQVSSEDSIFKSEASFSIDLQKSEPLTKSWSPPKQTSSGMHFNHPEHGTVSVQKQPSGEFHVKHNGAMAGLKGSKGSFGSASDAGQHAKAYMQSVGKNKVLAPKMQDHASPNMIGKSEMKKGMSAGSGMASPGSLVGGAALGKESLDKKMKKSTWLKRAETEYASWSKREEFENFMAKSMPELTKGEVAALGQTLCLKKSLKAEKALKKMMRDSGQDSWVKKKEK